MKPVAALCLLPLLLAACGEADPRVAEAEEITALEIRPILGADQIKISKLLMNRRVRGCAEMYGVQTDRAGTEYLILCSDDPTQAMLQDFTDPGWTVWSAFFSTRQVLPGNHTLHCAPIPSNRDVCARL